MKIELIVALGIASGIASGAAPRPAVESLPISFEPNRGQADASAHFVARGAGYYVTLNPTGSQLLLHKGGKTAQLETRLLGAKPGSQLHALEPLPGYSSWFRGNDPAKWVTGVPTYARVQATSVYPGIDLVYYGNQSRLEYDFVVSPGANPAKIRFAFQGATALRKDAAGNLVVSTPAGDLVQNKPVIYQTVAGVRRPVNGNFAIQGNIVSFHIGRYDRREPLTIDPVLVYSSFLGGGDTDEGHAVATDNASNMYMTGVTYSTPDGYADVLLRKINADGTAFLYNADLGGSDDDVANGIAVDANGFVYLGGRTYSLDFPTAGAKVFQSKNYDFDNAAWVMRIDPSATSMIYSTYVGGTGDDRGYALAIDKDGNAYLAGTASSRDFPTSSGAFQTQNRGDYDCFVFKIDNQGNAIYSTLIGGGSDDEAFAVAVDNDGNAYITGQSNSDSYPTANESFQHSRHGSYDAIITELNATGTGLIFSTFAGGNNDDSGNAITVDRSGNIYVAGTTASDSDFAGMENRFQSSYQGGDYDQFVLKYLPGGSKLAWATYLGTHGTDEANGIAVDANGNIYVAGDTNSDQFPVTGDAIQGSRARAFDATLAVLDNEGTKLYFSTFFGGQGDETFSAIALDPYYNVYLTGYTSSTDLPLRNALQSKPGGGDEDALLVKFDLSTSGIPGAAPRTDPVITTTVVQPSATVSAFGRGMVAPQKAAKFSSAKSHRVGAQASIESAATDEPVGRTNMRPNR